LTPPTSQTKRKLQANQNVYTIWIAGSHICMGCSWTPLVLAISPCWCYLLVNKPGNATSTTCFDDLPQHLGRSFGRVEWPWDFSLISAIWWNMFVVLGLCVFFSRGSKTRCKPNTVQYHSLRPKDLYRHKPDQPGASWGVWPSEWPINPSSFVVGISCLTAQNKQGILSVVNRAAGTITLGEDRINHAGHNIFGNCNLLFPISVQMEWNK
jgi:hypothetical protein